MQEFENKNRLNDYNDILNENPLSPLKDEDKNIIKNSSNIKKS